MFVVRSVFQKLLDPILSTFLPQYEELNSMGMLLTDTQRKWVSFLKEAARKKPPTRQIRPKVSILCVVFIYVQEKIRYFLSICFIHFWINFNGFLLQEKVFAVLYDVVTGDKFEIAILTVIMCNMVMMTIQHYGQSAEITSVLHILSQSD